MNLVKTASPYGLLIWVYEKKRENGGVSHLYGVQLPHKTHPQKLSLTISLSAFQPELTSVLWYDLPYALFHFQHAERKGWKGSDEDTPVRRHSQLGDNTSHLIFMFLNHWYQPTGKILDNMTNNLRWIYKMLQHEWSLHPLQCKKSSFSQQGNHSAV